LRFNDDAASAVEDVKLQKPSLDPIGLSQLLASDGEFQGVFHSESVDDVPNSFSNNTMTTGRQYDLPYLAEQWDETDSHVEELIALIGDYSVARAAFDEAVKRRPGRIVTLRQKTRLLADSRNL
jgi:hypothetical protein